VIVLDTSAVLALADGHRKLARVADNAAASPFRHLLVPSLCLMQAEIEAAGSSMNVLALPGIDVEPLDAVSSVAVATMVRDGLGGPDTCHALYLSIPSPQRPETDIVLTGREGDYPPGTVTVGIDDKRLDD
jgi:hypothetical protein